MKHDGWWVNITYTIIIERYVPSSVIILSASSSSSSASSSDTPYSSAVYRKEREREYENKRVCQWEQKIWVLMTESEREKEREWEKKSVWERERETERERQKEKDGHKNRKVECCTISHLLSLLLLLSCPGYDSVCHLQFEFIIYKYI